MYITKFDWYAVCTKYNDIALMFIFERNLKIEFWKESVWIFNKTISKKFNNLAEFKKKTINTNQQFWELNLNLKKYHKSLIHGNYILAKNHKPTRWNNPMENVQYNNIQQKKSHNNNFKESIICYRCGWKNHIKKNNLVFKSKKLYPKIKNMISHQEVNDIKSYNVRIFNIIHTIPFVGKKHW